MSHGEARPPRRRRDRGARRLVAAALWLFPPAFRRRFGAGMREAFTDRLREAGERGRGAWLAALGATLADVAVSAAREWIRPTFRGGAGTGTTTGGGGSMLDALRQDLRFALRSLRRRPGFTAVAVGTLAVGIGANTAIFSIVDGVLLTPLPYPEAERIVAVGLASLTDPEAHGTMSAPDLLDLEATDAFERVVGYSGSSVTLTGMGEAEVVPAARVTGSLLATFGLTPVLGRDIRPDEAVEGVPAVVVLSHAFWRERLGADREVLGRTLALNGVLHEVVGVAPVGFDFPSGTRLWRPFPLSEGCGRGCHNLRGVGRLEADASIESAVGQALVVAQRLQDAYPESNLDAVFHLVPLGTMAVADVRAGLWILLGAVGLVLLIVCANVANLLLVRAQTRTGEVAVRSALGASGGRLAAQVMVESLVLAALGGALGLALSLVGVEAVRALAPADVPRLDEVAVDGTALAFATALVAVVALLFGAMPALRLARTSPAGGLGGTARGASSSPDVRSRGLLLVGEVALSLVLLVGAGLLLKSFSRLLDVDPGYRTADVVRFNLSLPEAGYPDLDALGGFFQEMESRIAAIPGVDAVGTLFGAPLAPANAVANVKVEGRPAPPPGRENEAAFRPSTPGYFETLGIPVLRGRGLLASDRNGDRPVAVVSQRFVEENFPGQDPLGERIGVSIDFGYGEPVFEVVGVVADVRSESLAGDTRAAVYVPLAQMGPGFVAVHVRARPGTPSLLPALRSVVREMDPDLPLRNAETLGQVVSRELAPSRFYLVLLGCFAVVAVGLAAVGLYGVVAYLVTLRTREVGVRMALGAGRGDVMGLLVGQGMRPAAVGIGLGLVAALLAGPVLQGLLFEVEPRDPMVLGGVTALLVAVVLLASALPAWRATRIPAARSLRGE